MTKGERDRAYRVQMHALSEEVRVMKLPKDEVKRREKEIWESCYGKGEADAAK